MGDVKKFSVTDIVSVTLVLYVLFVTATSVFYPKDEDHEFALLMAIYYGLNIVAIVIYFICTQLDLFSPSEKQNKMIDVFLRYRVFNVCLISNLFLTTIAFLLFVIYALYLPYQFIVFRLFDYTLMVLVSWLGQSLVYILVANIFLGLVLGVSAIVITFDFLWSHFIKITKNWLSH